MRRGPRVVAIAATASMAVTTLAGVAAPASAQDVQRQGTPSDVIFLGDSVTAGFGFFGAQENQISGATVNTEFADNWVTGSSSLDKCDPPATPDDRCSNNNFGGQPWNAGPWTPGPNSPNVSYSFQIAEQQNPSAAATIENWAVTGSTPAQWDATSGGVFGTQLSQIADQQVVMTLGANPLLDAFLDIKVAGYPASSGACSATGEYFKVWGGWYANDPATVVACGQQQWVSDEQTEHLTNIYNTLLDNGNDVLVMGYYANCPWSFTNWQPEGNVIEGPSSGNSCDSQSEVDANGNTVTQTQQAWAVGNALNSYIAAAVASVQQSNPNGANLQFALPDQAQWQQHQGWDSDPWIFPNDTWIHPNKEGHGQLAQTVIDEACVDFGQWCGDQPSWVTGTQASAAAAKKKQRIDGVVKKRLGTRQARHLPSYTKQGQVIDWNASKRSRCHVFLDKVVSHKRAGSCTVTAKAMRSHALKGMTKTVTIKVVRR